MDSLLQKCVQGEMFVCFLFFFCFADLSLRLLWLAVEDPKDSVESFKVFSRFKPLVGSLLSFP